MGQRCEQALCSQKEDLQKAYKKKKKKESLLHHISCYGNSNYNHGKTPEGLNWKDWKYHMLTEMWNSWGFHVLLVET